jgi:hypothetical protein
MALANALIYMANTSLIRGSAFLIGTNINPETGIPKTAVA